MMKVQHRPSLAGWEYDSLDGFIHGGGRTLHDSIANADHAARQELSRMTGREVPLREARHQVQHVDATPARMCVFVR